MQLFNYIIKRKTSIQTEKATEESAKVRALKKEIDALDQLLKMKDTRIESLTKELEIYYGQKQENRIFDIVEKVLNPNTIKTIQNGAIDDNLILDFLKSIPKDQLTKAKKLDLSTFTKQVASKQPQLNEKTIHRAYELIDKVIA